MVTKLKWFYQERKASSVLAKIHMVTKHNKSNMINASSSVLAKIHMVTKQGV